MALNHNMAMHVLLSHHFEQLEEWILSLLLCSSHAWPGPLQSIQKYTRLNRGRDVCQDQQ